MEDAGLTLRAGGIGGIAEKCPVVEGSHGPVRQQAERTAGRVSIARNFDSFGGIVKVPLVSKIGAGIGLHLAREFHVLGARDAKVARQTGFAHRRICHKQKERRQIGTGSFLSSSLDVHFEDQKRNVRHVERNAKNSHI